MKKNSLSICIGVEESEFGCKFGVKRTFFLKVDFRAPEVEKGLFRVRKRFLQEKRL